MNCLRLGLFKRRKKSPLVLFSICARIPALFLYTNAFRHPAGLCERTSFRPSCVLTKPQLNLYQRNMETQTFDEGSRVQLTVCEKCKGEGKLIQPPSRKARKRHKLSFENQKQNHISQPPPRIDGCKVCEGSGLVEQKASSTISDSDNVKNLHVPHVAIVGGGLGGLALAVALRHRSISCTVYERDEDFFQRSQGYGLTMQQASRALKSLDISVPLADGVVSTKHVVHTPEGRVVGEWGLRKWLGPSEHINKNNQTTSDKLERQSQTTNNNANKNSKRQNVHIARQSLRYELLQALGGPSQVQWGHRLVEFNEHNDHIDLIFEVGQSSAADKEGTDSNETTTTTIRHETAGLLVGADGIRSSVRRQLIGEEPSPLRYLGCIVILGICSITPDEIRTLQSPLLDGETVFQTADGSTRIYMMPYSKTEYMWQLSFPMDEQDAKVLSERGPQALKEESLKKCHAWHDPIVPILRNTPVSLVSGYPVYDRDLLTKEILQGSNPSSTASSMQSSARRVTVLGDAAHPMSPFKGQGANQALLDALSLARMLYKVFGKQARVRPGDNHQDISSQQVLPTSSEAKTNTSTVLLHEVLDAFEEEMMSRSAVKVKASAEAAHFLHTEIAIQEGNVTRGEAASRSCSSSTRQ